MWANDVCPGSTRGENRPDRHHLPVMISFTRSWLVRYIKRVEKTHFRVVEPPGWDFIILGVCLVRVYVVKWGEKTHFGVVRPPGESFGKGYVI